MLYLKKIEVYGFKSFADKLELKFDQPITGIVGPNGCGKSNVSDSIRWVLGEQSTKNLRGKSMQDLIFNGTDTRKSMSYCEVSLFIDNTTRIFPIQMDEIIISRKLYRNNESEYLLNRNTVRLKDILDLLRSVGLGKEGYSIVGQGRMDAILNARPEDRRAIFEEALGISRFRIKKVETERKLEKTRINMDSLNILSKELERQIEPLRKQSVTAKKYLELYEQLRYNEINAYIYGYDNASQDKENAKKKVQGLKEEYALKETQYAEINELYDELFHKLNGIDSSMAALRDRQVTLAVDLQKQVGDKNLVRERIKNCERDILSNERQSASFTEEKIRLENSVTENTALLGKRREEHTSLENEILRLNDKYSEICARTEKISGETENARRKLEETLRSLSDLNGKRAAFQAETETLNNRLGEIAEKEKEISQRLTELEGEEGNLLERYEQAKKLRDELQKRAAEHKKEVKQLEYAQFEAAKKLQERQQAYAGEKGGIDLLRDFADNYKGYQSSVQNLMQDAQRNRELSSRICGTVANLLRVETRYQTAVEAALGNRLQNIVTENEEDTKYVINYLHENVYGRATFLPVSSMKPHFVERPEVLKEKGILGIARDLVSFDAHYKSVFDSLLGGIIIADTFDNAVAISRKYKYVHRIVTLSGDKISNDGSFEGGSKRVSNGNLLSYETQLEERMKKLAELKSALDTAESEKHSADARLQETRSEFNRITEQLNDVNISIATDREKIETSNTLNNSDKKNILGLSSEKERIARRLEEIAVADAQCDKKLKELTSSEKLLEEKINRFRDALQAESAAKDSMQELLSGKRYRLAVLKSNIDASEKEINAANTEIVSLERKIESASAYCEQVRKAIDGLYEVLNKSAEDSQAQSEMAEVLEQIKSVDTLKAELNAEFQRTGEERMRLSNELENLRGVTDKEEYILNKIDDDLQELQQRVAEAYGITYSAAMQFKDENFDKEGAKNRISELKAAVQKLGYVNVNAINELTEIEERYGGIGSQLEDLRKAQEDLDSILKELTGEIETRFEEGMSQINENFKTVFRELFNGGNARLYIDKDETKAPLDQGVEIEAQPPGKRLQNISLLSGGERTMTAAAILFSILKFQPMPFCVLDEIEAALDDANAERIAKYLRKFSASTQFIVITHKKPTMENADVLYGVTMEEKGVSKIVSVKLTEAIRQAM